MRDYSLVEISGLTAIPVGIDEPTRDHWKCRVALLSAELVRSSNGHILLTYLCHILVGHSFG